MEDSLNPLHLQATWQTLPSYMEESCTLGATAAASAAEAAAAASQPPPPPTTTQGGGGDNEVRKMSTSSGSATSPEVMDTISPT